jgi:hypothetical protein
MFSRVCWESLFRRGKHFKMVCLSYDSVISTIPLPCLFSFVLHPISQTCQTRFLFLPPSSPVLFYSYRFRFQTAPIVCNATFFPFNELALGPSSPTFFRPLQRGIVHGKVNNSISIRSICFHVCHLSMVMERHGWCCSFRRVDI